MKIISNSEKETQDIGLKFAKRLKGGEVIALLGNLGSGKTIFTKGLARGLGVRKIITSPTFVLMKLYQTWINVDQNADQRRYIRENLRSNPRKSAIEWLCHVDAYRLKNERELREIGLFDWLGKENSIVAIEWAEKVKKILPKTAIQIKIKLGKKETERHFLIE